MTTAIPWSAQAARGWGLWATQPPWRGGPLGGFKGNWSESNLQACVRIRCELGITFEDSNRLSPGGLGSSPGLYIQAEALQGIAFHPGSASNEQSPGPFRASTDYASWQTTISRTPQAGAGQADEHL